jgi:ribosome biogenesis protein MAK21
MGKFHQQQHKKNAPVQNRPLGKAFVVPDRKQVAAAAAPAKPAQAKPVNNDRVEHNKSHQAPAKAKQFPPAKRSWWDSVPTLEEKDLIKFEEGQHWHSKLPAFLDTANTNPSYELNGDRLTAACKAIDNAYHQQLKLYGEWLKNSTEMKGDLKWMNDMIKSGTMSDKVAAMALKVQSSPFHELDTLDALMAMALKKEQRGAQLSMEALKDLFVNNLLAPRGMRSMDANALNHPEMTLSTALLVWYEAQIKTRYERLLEALETGLKSNVDYFKRECLQTVSELLIGKPEQESRLLAMLVNKLGDPSRATCSKAIEVLKQVMRAHPAMKIVIVREVRQFLYRPNLKIRPVFNGIILLSQVQLTSKADHAVAVQLVEGYLSLFEKTMKEEEYGSRLLSALLTGINKALPYLQNTDSLDKYVDPLFKIVHTATSFSTATQAMMLLSHLALSSSNSASTAASATNSTAAPAQDGKTAPQESAIIKRYYRALYAKLLSEQVSQLPFLSLYQPMH